MLPARARAHSCLWEGISRSSKMHSKVLEELKHSKSDSTQPTQSHMQVVLNISWLRWCDELLATARARLSGGRPGASFPERSSAKCSSDLPCRLPCRPHQKLLLSRRRQPCWIMRWVMAQTNIHQETGIRPKSLAVALQPPLTCSLSGPRRLPTASPDPPYNGLDPWGTKTQAGHILSCN